MIKKNNYFIHETAIVESEDIGENTKIWAYSHISKNAKIGNNCTIGEGVYIGPNVVIGDRCRIQNHSLLYDGVELGNDVFIGPSVVTTNDYFPTLPVEDWSERFKKTILNDNVSVGANSTIICGITMGKRSMSGAGSVITKDVPEGTLVYGNPARIKRKI